MKKDTELDRRRMAAADRASSRQLTADLESQLEAAQQQMALLEALFAGLFEEVNATECRPRAEELGKLIDGWETSAAADFGTANAGRKPN